ncbi:tubulointerstitial nephritis antigen [Trichinella spiralis]|uniref:tubulointerstitial nephritis antigen n=1 Tax=Trichinella spiralis TaxID=6334 RepID=UPI0001EFE611|nr:tubulointerstitial nephritis antigen [Trichinella spiralis]
MFYLSNSQEARKAEYVLVPQEHGPESESWNKNTIYQTEANVEDNNDELSFSLPRRNNLCYCDEACIRLNDCCTDYHSVCPGMNDAFPIF